MKLAPDTGKLLLGKQITTSCYWQKWLGIAYLFLSGLAHGSGSPCDVFSAAATAHCCPHQAAASEDPTVVGGTSHVRLPNRLGFLEGCDTTVPGASLRCNAFDILTFQKIRSSDVVEMWRGKSWSLPLKSAAENHKVTGKRSISIASDFISAKICSITPGCIWPTG